MIRSFNQWYSTIPKKIQVLAKKYYDYEKPTQQLVNYIVISNLLLKNEELNPTTEEIIHWVRTHQIEKSIN